MRIRCNSGSKNRAREIVGTGMDQRRRSRIDKRSCKAALTFNRDPKLFLSMLFLGGLAGIWIADKRRNTSSLSDSHNSLEQSSTTWWLYARVSKRRISKSLPEQASKGAQRATGRKKEY